MKTALVVLLLCVPIAFAAPPSPPTGLVVGGDTLVLHWGAVTENIDGTPCYDLAGYRVYYSAISPVMKSDPRFDTGLNTVYVVGGLVHGAWYYFAATAFDFAGNESPLSDEILRRYP